MFPSRRSSSSNDTCGLLTRALDGPYHWRFFSFRLKYAFTHIISYHVCTYAMGTVSSLADLADPADERGPEVYKASLVFEFVTWSIILVFTLAKASAVTAKCESIQLQVCIAVAKLAWQPLIAPCTGHHRAQRRLHECDARGSGLLLVVPHEPAYGGPRVWRACNRELAQCRARCVLALHPHAVPRKHGRPVVVLAPEALHTVCVRVQHFLKLRIPELSCRTHCPEIDGTRNMRLSSEPDLTHL